MVCSQLRIVELFLSDLVKRYTAVWLSDRMVKAEDIELNVCKTKHLTNTRSSSADEALKLTPPRVLSLEQAIEFIDQDELLEGYTIKPSYP